MNAQTNDILATLREATHGTAYEGHLFLVGGFVRDIVMGLSSASDDIDIVLESDALALARFLREAGIAQYEPVVYPRFGTAMVVISGRDIELVTARIESYSADSRKPEDVKPGTLLEDARRRDFTINTLLQNLHSGEIQDPLGKALSDIAARILRTPTDPKLTFQDDPLRMLRAIRFSARFGFQIAPDTRAAIVEAAPRLRIISAERIRDEFCKTLLTPRASLGLTLLRNSGLLAQFAPELVAMVGVTQNEFHAFPVWEHTLIAVQNLPADASLTLRLATLFHDVGKPGTKSTGEDGRVHFYEHQKVGAEMTRAWMNRMKFSNDEITAVTTLVAQHMRIGEYKPLWSDAAVRRLIRDLGTHLEDLFAIHRADVFALAPGRQDISRAQELRDRIVPILNAQDISALTSPLDGAELMRLLGLPPGRQVGEIKEYLTDAVIEGRLAPDDKEAAAKMAAEMAHRNEEK